MEFTEPLENIFTVYSKSGCYNCMKVKTLLTEKKCKFVVVDCDEYLFEDKEGFLAFVKKITKKEWKTFPMVFNNKHFIGGFIETQHYVDKLLCFNDDF